MPSSNVPFIKQVQVLVCASASYTQGYMTYYDCGEDCQITGPNWYIDFECCYNATAANTTTNTTTTNTTTSNTTTAASCTSTIPSIIQPSGFSNKYEKLINGDQVSFELGVFTSDLGCSITSYELFESDSVTSKHDWAITNDSSSVLITLPDHLKDSPLNFSVILRVTADHRHT